MSGVNKAIIVGRLGHDPEVKNTPTGTAVCTFSLATSQKYTDGEGVTQEKTEWHRCVAWRRLAEVIAQYTRKGSQIYVEGRIETQKWEDSEGRKRYTTQIVVLSMQLLGSRNDSPGKDGNQGGPAPEQTRTIDDTVDDLPF